MPKKILILFFIIFGCNTTIQVKETYFGGQYCSGGSDVKNIPFSRPLPFARVDHLLRSHGHFSFKSLMIANAYGILPLIEKMEELEKKTDYKDINSPTHLEFVFTKNKIHEIIFLVSTDLTGTVSELNCYSDRIDDIIKHLRYSENQRITQFYIAAIVVGGIFGILSGILQWASATVQATDSIIGGLAVGYISYQAYQVETHVNYLDAKNVLKDIWYRPHETEIFSSPVWYLLNHPTERKRRVPLKQMSTILDILISRWLENGYLGAEGTSERESLIQLYFSRGGVHTIEQLETRKQMVKQAGVTVNLFFQDLQNFGQELLRHN
ncbi:hypothetical protein EHO60_01515 [Leptospira fletcheri]|uniref:Lipoprotein n=1 Tax=Leptospira fletcheri TaxID=2484981 RepID=A0A4R9GJY5_9LEPT|nr:hypothetical protein [Leptospira fletcheri]TGK14048.1 hypothetical protein EHO60_01515 [Leptospira fletcheri]